MELTAGIFLFILLTTPVQNCTCFGCLSIHPNRSATGVLNLSWHTLSRPSCQHKSAHRSGRLENRGGCEQRASTVSLNLRGLCPLGPAFSGDPELRWSYGDGHPGLNQPHGCLVQRVHAFLVLHCAENVLWQTGAIGRTDHWAANKISCLVVFRRSSVLLLPWGGGNVPPGGTNTPAGVARRRAPTEGGDVWGIPPTPEACNILSSVGHSK